MYLDLKKTSLMKVDTHLYRRVRAIGLSSMHLDVIHPHDPSFFYRLHLSDALDKAVPCD